MSSHNQETSEDIPLLRRPARRSSTILSDKSTFAPETFLIPVVLSTRLGNGIPSTTLFELFRQTVCRLSITLRGHSANFIHGPLPPQLCESPEVVRDFAIVIAIFAAIGGFLSLVGCGILTRLLPHYGRKPAFLFMIIMEITWSGLIPASQFMPVRIADWVFLVGMLFHVIANALPYGYLVDMFIVDVCHPEERTATMSQLGGYSALGVCIPLALGGSITTKTGNPFIVFYISIAIFIATFIYAAAVLPETLSEERRKEMLPKDSDAYPTSRLASLLLIFEPLKLLIPPRTSSGTRNWRLTWCALHTFVFIVANAYALSAWMVLATSKYHFTPADTGLFFTVLTSSGMITLSVILPRLFRILRPYYRRTTNQSTPAEEGRNNTEAVVPETSDHLNVHLGFVSYVILGIALLCTALSTTHLQVILSVIMIGLSWIHNPTTRSLVIGSVSSPKQGEALAAIEMVHSAGRILSPVIMGGIFTATLDTAPLLLFYVHLVVVLISAGLLLLVRDSDRFQESSKL